MEKLSREQIKQYLPHREPFIFVDSVDEFSGSSIKASLNLRREMPFFAGHFPEEPIMPGVLMQEALAQASGLVISLQKNSGGGIFYLASANIKFLEVVRPDCVLELRSRLERSFGGLYQFAVEACAGGKTAARGTIVLASAK